VGVNPSTVIQEITIKASAERIFEALTSAGERLKWSSRGFWIGSLEAIDGTPIVDIKPVLDRNGDSTSH
jgi:uncharacterized protein YndB with AHSA1/START domain